MNEPPRLFESDPSARDAIDAARSDVPDPKRLAKIAAGAAAAATVTTAATASATAATALKIVGAIVVVGTAVGVGVAVTHTTAPPNVAPSTTVSAPISAPATATASAPATATATATASATASASVPVPVPVPAADEMSLLDEAQRAMATDPQKALGLCEKDAKANPKGAMAQEREVLAIDALMRLGRQSEAKERAAKFHAQWPDSAHGRRVDALVELH